MSKKSRLIGVLLLVALAAGWTAVRAAEEPAVKDAVFKMEEVSAFDGQVAGLSVARLGGGPIFMCTPTPNPEVKTYPKLNSKQPLYGTVMFGGARGSAPVVRYHFVLDESEQAAPPAETPKAEEKPESKTEPPPKPGTLVERSRLGLPGSVPETKYDLLYFDANHDLDLTNDPVVKVMKEPPKGLPLGPNLKVFDAIGVEIPAGGDAPAAKVRVVPLLQVYTGMRMIAAGGADKAKIERVVQAYLRFMPATVRMGKIQLGKQDYTAILSSSGQIMARLNDPQQTRLQLIPAGEEQSVVRTSSGMDGLGVMREVDGVLCQFSATPNGDELRLSPYRGDLGIFEIVPANKEVKDRGVLGVLMGKERTVVFGGPAMSSPPPEPKAAQHKLPVGDYSGYYLALRVGNAAATLRQNAYYESRTPGGPEPNVHIAKDKPLVLDFSQKPKVVFTTPPAGTPVRTGDTVMIRAILIEPTLDLRFLGLEDKSRKTGEMKYMGADGKPVSMARFASLDPDIAILDSTGKKVAEGKMPFG
jgi:hypothetical protein